MKKAIFGLLLGALLVLPIKAWAQEEVTTPPPSDAEAQVGTMPANITVNGNEVNLQDLQKQMDAVGYNSGAAVAAGIGATIFMAFVYLIGYIYGALCIYKYGKKTQSPHAWWGWVPILQIFEFVRATGQSYWWILALFVPLVNLVVGIWLYAQLCIRFNKSGWLALLMLVPIANLVLPGYLAFSE